MWETVLTNLLIGVATAVVAALGKALNDWNKREKEKASAASSHLARSEAVEALRVGVLNTQVDFVDALKKGAEDGKLSKDDIKKARDKAIKTATDVAVGPGLTWLTSLTTNAANGLIDAIVQGNKR